MYKCISYIDALERKSGFQKSGDNMKDVYEYQEIDGKKTLVKTGKVDIQEEIESFAKSCDIGNILARFANGEVDLLNASPGFYGDVRDMPKNYADYYSRVKEADKIFYNLPEDLRDKFNNSPEEFFRSFGSDKFMEAITPDIKDTVPESEVRDAE